MTAFLGVRRFLSSSAGIPSLAAALSFKFEASSDA